MREGLQYIWDERKGNGKLPEHRLASSAPRRISLSSHTLLAAFPFQIGIVLSSHLPLVFLDAAVCLISYCRCRGLCVLLNLSLSKCCPSLDSHSFHCLCSWLRFQLRPGQCGKRGEGFDSRWCWSIAWLHCLTSSSVLEKYHCTPTAHQLCFVTSAIYASQTVRQSEVTKPVLPFCHVFSYALFAQPALLCTKTISLGPFFPLVQYGWLCS